MGGWKGFEEAGPRGKVVIFEAAGFGVDGYGSRFAQASNGFQCLACGLARETYVVDTFKDRT